MNDLRSLRGYSEGSPWENAPFNLIKTSDGRITMSNTKKKLKAFDAKTGKFLSDLLPGKEYQFPVKDILEIPFYQDGGIKLPKYAKAYLSGQTGDIQTIAPKPKIPINKTEEVIKENYKRLRRNPYLKLYSDKELDNISKKNPKEWPKDIYNSVNNYDASLERASMHPDFNPSILAEKQLNLNNDNSIRTRVLRGRNIFMNSNGIPIVSDIAKILASPGSSFANMTMDAENQYVKPGLGKGLLNLGADILNVAPTEAAVLANKGYQTVKPVINNAGKYLTEKTILKDAHKLNPFAFKPNPEAYYRMLGENGMKDAIEKGILKTPVGSRHGENVWFNKGFPKDSDWQAYTLVQMNKGKPISGWAGYKGPYMAEAGPKVSDNFVSVADLEPTPHNLKFNTTKGIVNPNNPFKYSDPNIKFYKKNWLKGYREVPKQSISKNNYLPTWEDSFEAVSRKNNPNFNIEAFKNDGKLSAPLRELPENLKPFNKADIQKSEIGWENWVKYKEDFYDNPKLDMTNPNIYKALVPAVAGAGILSQQKKPKEEFKNGGKFNMDRIKKFQPGGSFFNKRGMNIDLKNILQSYIKSETPIYTSNDCPQGYVKDANGNCVEDTGYNPSQFLQKGISIIPTKNDNGQIVGGTGATPQPFHTDSPVDKENISNGGMELKRRFGTPNIPAIIGTNLLSFGLSTVANNIEQGRQKAFMMKQMNDPLFNGSYSFAQNDYGVDPYEQTGQLRPTYQQGGRTPITVTNPNDPRLKAYNDSLNLYNNYQVIKKNLQNQNYKPLPNGNMDYNTAVNKALTSKNLFRLRKEDENMYSVDDLVPWQINRSLGRQLISTKIKPTNVEQFTNGNTPSEKLISWKKNSNSSGNRYDDNGNYYTNTAGKTISDQRAIANYSNVNPVQPIVYQAPTKKPVQPVVYQKSQQGWKPFDGKGGNWIDPQGYIWDDRYPESDNYKKKPVAATQPQPQEPKFKAPARVSIDRPSVGNMKFNPNIPTPDMQRAEWNNTKPTKWSFTYPTGPYNKQKTIYFPDKTSWKNFIQDQRGMNSQEGEDYGTATGYMKMGGNFNIIDYLYGDDETKEAKETKEEIKTEAKKKKTRITEENVDQLSLLGLSIEDILNSTNPSMSLSKRRNLSSSKGFRNFSNYEEGRNALENQLNLYKTGKTKVGLKSDSTLLEAMSKYAPYGDGANDPVAYANFIAKKAGVTVNTPISQIDTKKWADAIEKIEGNKVGNNPGNLRAFEKGGTYLVDFNTMMNLKKKGIKFKIVE